MLIQAALFVLDALVGFLTLALLLRFYMQAFRVSFGNPFGSFVVELTNWLVKPLRKVLPSVFGLDLATLLPAYLLQVVLLLAVFAAAFSLYLGCLYPAIAPRDSADMAAAAMTLGVAHPPARPQHGPVAPGVPVLGLGHIADCRGHPPPD